MRHNEGKLRYDLVPVYWPRILAEVCTQGAAKYDDWNWDLAACRYRRICDEAPVLEQAPAFTDDPVFPAVRAIDR